MKVAISLPDPVFNAAEQLAEQLHVSRSQLYAQAIVQYLQRVGAPAVTAKLNAVYGRESSTIDPAFGHAQSSVLDDEAW
jgi:metal-responsive CopG/Arc/MetJ family transcriptional regulator